jgi:hypothetical protein
MITLHAGITLEAAGAPANLPQLLLNLVLALLACAVVIVLLLLGLQLLLVRSLVGGIPRFQQKRFVDRLRAEAFADPARVIGTLSGNNAGAYLHHLWAGAKGDAGRAAAAVAQSGEAASNRFKDVMEQSWPAVPLTARPVPIGGDWSLVVVSLPPPERNNETYFVGIALPTAFATASGAGAAAADADLARRAVRFFQLNKWSLNRDTDFIEHTTAGRELTYNIGTDVKVEAFAEAVEEKVHVRPLHRAAATA